MTDIPRWRIALVAIALVVLGAIGAGLVLANDPANSPSAVGSPAASSPAAAGVTGGTSAARPNALARLLDLGARLRRIVHIEATLDLPNKGIVTAGVDHGTIATIGSGSIDVSEKDGQTVTIKTDTNTKVRKGGALAKLDDLKKGDEVFVTSRLEGGSFVAIRIIVPPAAKTP
ncbi:MAG: DUF5666 domain-containing protein [Candidatus Limnocylindrales bacterium]